MLHESQEIVKYVNDSFAAIAAERDLTPTNPNVSRIFGELVAYVVKPRNPSSAEAAVTALKVSGVLQKMRGLCQSAESQLESHFSALIGTGEVAA